jgi:hypothetical protein
MRDAFLDVAWPDHVEHPTTPVLDLGFAQCLTHTRNKLTVGRRHHDVRRQSAAKKAKERVLAEAQQIIVELRIGNDAELLDGIANFHSLSPYICLDKFRGADWDAHASHAGDRNDIGRRVKNVIQACKGWVLVQLLTDELISAFQTNEEG